MNRRNQTESVVFLLCRFTVFPKDPLFRVFKDLLEGVSSVAFIITAHEQTQ